MITPISVGMILDPASLPPSLLSTGGGWIHGGTVYVLLGMKGWEVKEIRGTRASWNF